MLFESNHHLFHRCAALGRGTVSSAKQRRQDAESWEAFVEAYGPMLRSSIRMAFYRCGAPFTEHDVEEAEQEVYCRLLEQGRRRLRQFRGRSEAQARKFLRRVSWSVVVDSLRRGAAQKRGGSRHREATFVAQESVLFLLSASSTPESEALRRERCRLLLERCRRIASRGLHGRRNLQILHWAVVEGHSSREIARQLGFQLSVSAIDSVVYRMRRALANEGLELPERRL